MASANIYLGAGISGIVVFTLGACAFVARGGAIRTATPLNEQPPYWAYVVNPPDNGTGTSASAADAVPRHVPDSEAAFTVAATKDFFKPPDWHAGDHPEMPEIVGHGRAPKVFACGYCHLPNGQGRPENSSLAGLPEGYIIQQLADFKNGLRKSSEPRHGPTNAMIANESQAGGKEVRASAEYFSGLRPRPWIRVVETAMVPKTKVAGWMLVPSDGNEKEAIGQRIIETPENLERTELRDDHSGFVAYVPEGSVKKGEAIASGADKALRCATCHGRDLKGMANVPRLAGRSPSYMVRQLYDMQHGSRRGAASRKMKLIVENLTVDDMIALAAYAASLAP